MAAESRSYLPLMRFEGIDVQAETVDVADKIAELASQRFRVPLTLNIRRFKSDLEEPLIFRQKAERADLRFDLSGPREAFEETCRDPKSLADAFGVMEALCEKAGEKKNGSTPRALYLIQVGDDPIVKIGVSANPYRRLLDLQGAHYRELFLWGVVFSPDVKAMTLEQRALELASQQGNRLMGEWIAAAPGKVFADVLNLAAEHKVAICNAEVWLHNMLERTKRIAKSNSLRSLTAIARRSI